MAKRNARVELTLDKDRFDRGLEAAGRKMRKFARDGATELSYLDRAKGIAGKAARGLGGAGLGLARRGLQGLGVAAAVGGVGLISMADNAMVLEKSLTRYQIATNASDAQLAQFRTRLGEVTRASGVGRQELLDGAAAYVALTGDANGAAAGMELFAKVQNATGAQMADVATTAAAMRDNLAIDPKDFEAGFSALVVQGKAGAVELRDLAAEMADLAPAMSGFKGGKGLRGLIETGAALQVVKKGAGTASKAATNLAQLSNAMIRNSKKFKAKGIRIFDRKGEKRNFLAIIDDIRKKKLTEPQLINLLGSSEAMSAMRELLSRKDLLNELIATGADKGAIDRDASKYLESPAGRVQRAWEAVKLKLAEAFTPERIEAFATKLEQLVGHVGTLIDGLNAVAGFMDKFLNGGPKQHIGILTDKTKAKLNMIEATSGGKSRMPSMANFKSDRAKLGMPVPASEEYSFGALAAYESQFTREFAGRKTTSFGTAQRAAAAVPFAGNVANDVMNGMLAAATKMNFTLMIDGTAVAKAAANSPVHRSRPGGR